MSTHSKLNKQALTIIRMKLESDSGERLQDMSLNAAMLLYDIAKEMVGDHAVKDILGDDAWLFVHDMIDGGQCEAGHKGNVQAECPRCFEDLGIVVPVTPFYVDRIGEPRKI